MRTVSLKEKERQLIVRKTELGGIAEEQVAAARNRGTRRTPEKRALLTALAEEAERKGRELPFPSNY